MYYFDLKQSKFYINEIKDKNGIKHKLEKDLFYLKMNHFPGATDFDTSINRETFTDILEKNKLFVQQYNK